MQRRRRMCSGHVDCNRIAMRARTRSSFCIAPSSALDPTPSSMRAPNVESAVLHPHLLARTSVSHRPLLHSHPHLALALPIPCVHPAHRRHGASLVKSKSYACLFPNALRLSRCVVFPARCRRLLLPALLTVARLVMWQPSAVARGVDASWRRQKLCRGRGADFGAR